MNYFGFSFCLSLLISPLPGLLIESLKKKNPKTASRNDLKLWFSLTKGRISSNQFIKMIINVKIELFIYYVTLLDQK